MYNPNQIIRNVQILVVTPSQYYVTRRPNLKQICSPQGQELIFPFLLSGHITVTAVMSFPSVAEESVKGGSRQ